MPVVVCDSSTLIHLARIGRLSLLTDFHSKIIVVPAVWKEVVDEGQSRPRIFRDKRRPRIRLD